MKPSIYFYVKPLSNTAMAKIYICERMGSAILSRKSSGITIPTKAWDDKKRTIKAMKSVSWSSQKVVLRITPIHLQELSIVALSREKYYQRLIKYFHRTETRNSRQISEGVIPTI